MDYADDLNSIPRLAIEHQMGPCREIAHPIGQFRTGGPHARIVGQERADMIQPIEQAVGSAKAVLGYVGPDLDEILFGASGAREASQATT